MAARRRSSTILAPDLRDGSVDSVVVRERIEGYNSFCLLNGGGGGGRAAPTLNVIWVGFRLGGGPGGGGGGGKAAHSAGGDMSTRVLVGES